EDLDGDGWVDLFATGGHIPAAAFIKNGTDNSNLLFAGGPNGFTLDPPGWSIPEPTPNSARGVSLGDANGDGRLDIAVSHVHGVLSIYETPDSHPIPLRIRPSPSVTGPTATGFRVQCTCGGTTRTRELASGGHLGSSSPSEIRLTFPGDCGIPGTELDLVVRWPSGYVQTIQTTMGAPLELVEPPWITLEGNTISLAPNDSFGAPVVSSSQLVISADHASVGPLTPDAGGFSATYIPDGEGPVRFSLAVDGVLLPVHPTRNWVGPEPRTLRTYPEGLIIGSGYTISAVPRDVNGNPLPAPLEVEFIVNGVPFPAIGNAGDGFSAQMAPPNTPGTVVIQLRVNGVDYGAPIERAITTAIDPQQSRLRVGPLYTTPETALSSMFRAYLVARDINGQSLDTESLSYELRVNDQVIVPILMTNEGGEVLLTYPAGTMTDGDEVRFFVDGVEFPGPQIFHVIPPDASAQPSLDVAQSKCSFAMATLVADGLDVATALFFPRDAFGNPIPGDVLPLSFVGNQGLEVIQDSVKEQENHWIFSVRAGLQTGISTVDVMIGGISANMPCIIETLEPTAVEIGSGATSSIEVIPDKLPAGTENTAKVKAYPRTANGRLIGSAATIELTAEGADLLDVSYRGIGLYRGTLEAAAEPGFATISLVDGDKVIATATVEMFDPNPAAESDENDDLGQSDTTISEPDTITADIEDDLDAAPEDAGTEDDATEPTDDIPLSDTMPQEDSGGPVDASDPADTALDIESHDASVKPDSTDTTSRRPPRTDLSTERRSKDITGNNRSDTRTSDTRVPFTDGGGCQSQAPSSQPTTLSLWLLTWLFIYHCGRRRNGASSA
ncbi:MAG: FG-GAP-like repeat-containing protein, partial [Myxococcota bacterium]|nr:FG-GAP-like repeat-containing protein [Myxococcota bacterium]